ncbi:MAG: hypothetical protein V8S96_07235 [Lachnospiraceae bacterium]
MRNGTAAFQIAAALEASVDLPAGAFVRGNCQRASAGAAFTNPESQEREAAADV